ncbi:hypothetical protein FHR81_001068 [Actinoalloteichus hoggarensis]|uniref:Uncharacterized protein n=1 Tax=Actinoalloteichus hoggarensis TaxID=1470176 RepID=A0A221VZ20_9PSEU|nr:hypothetical protein [Actinoalloteichus hoggarensis]ASO18805.1 hypothetical protein AHOG_05760 [Actinoalloteichus hoggarensis]MBB5920038.1 hypothetical protein [Actinoalloteichus hoggarensis]
MSRRAAGRLWRYLGSTKNLVGSSAGLLGVLLHLAGVAGSYWLLVVAGLYTVGALAAPPERVRLVRRDPTAEAAELVTGLRELIEEVDARQDRLPATTADRVREIGEVLGGVLDRPGALATDPETFHQVARIVRLDLPQSVQTYLNLPRWFAVTVRPGGERSAAGELSAQLELLLKESRRIASDFFAADLTRQADHTRYLHDRTEGRHDS